MIVREVAGSVGRKDRGFGFAIYYSIFKTPFGWCLVASTEKGICNILFSDRKNEVVQDLNERWPRAEIISKVLPAHRQIEACFKKTTSRTKFMKIKLHLYGTNFQIDVWEALLTIPECGVVSYGDLAEKLGDKKMSRAVGTAVGNNPIGYIIPCHRVLKSTGEIGGYRWGIERKRAMLGWEAGRRNNLK